MTECDLGGSALPADAADCREHFWQVHGLKTLVVPRVVETEEDWRPFREWADAVAQGWREHYRPSSARR